VSGAEQPDVAAGGEDGPGFEPSERLLEAVGHLQEAIVASVSAVRATLDVVEEVAKDPEPVRGLLAEVGRTFLGAVAGAGAAGPARDDAEAPERPRVERIRVDVDPDE
jgi:hypothetical protein